MAETPDLRKAAFRKRDSGPFIWFVILSLIVNGVGAVSGWWIKFPKPEEEKIIPLELVDDDVEKLGSPDAPEEPPPPDPEPTPPPPEPEPTPPPLDKPPEFEIPQATPTPTPAPVSTPQPISTPKPAKPAASAKPAPVAPSAPAPGLVKGSPTGAPNGTGHGAHTGAQFVRRPSPTYPPQAMQMHITGSVTVRITVSNGTITDVESVSGPPMLASAAVRQVRSTWVPTPGTSATYTLPIEFVMH
jgi:periplasmic protein TonB